MVDHVVVDVEIQRRVGEGGLTWEDTDKLGVGCAVLYEFRSDRFHVYGPGDVEALKARLLKADRITTFNGYRFDFPVIWGLPGRQRVLELKPKSNDLLQRIWKSLGLDAEQFSDLHKGWGLDTVCRGTLGVGKSGTGADAPGWFQAGEWPRLVDYCLNDVALERALAVFVDRFGYVVNAGTGQVLRLEQP